MHLLYVERKCFVNFHDLTFEKFRFLKASEFDEPPTEVYVLYNPSTATLSPELMAEPKNRPPPQNFDEIVAQPPPTLHVFKTYAEFQPDNDPPFSNVMRRPDANL
jgi:hypothetical protein